jgi:hypothetical protein
MGTMVTINPMAAMVILIIMVNETTTVTIHNLFTTRNFLC